MIVIVNGEIFINGLKTNDPQLIGYAILDFAEAQEVNSAEIVLKEPEEFINLN